MYRPGTCTPHRGRSPCVTPQRSTCAQASCSVTLPRGHQTAPWSSSRNPPALRCPQGPLWEGGLPAQCLHPLYPSAPDPGRLLPGPVHPRGGVFTASQKVPEAWLAALPTLPPTLPPLPPRQAQPSGWHAHSLVWAWRLQPADPEGDSHCPTAGPWRRTPSRQTPWCPHTGGVSRCTQPPSSPGEGHFAFSSCCIIIINVIIITIITLNR